MPPEDGYAIRFFLWQVFGLTTGLALALGISSYSGSVAVGIHLIMCLVGWVMWQILHMRTGAIIPLLVGSDLLLWVAHERAVVGSDDDFLGYRWLITLFASLLVTAGIVQLIRTGRQQSLLWKRHVAIAVTLIAVLFGLWMAIIVVGNASIARRRAADTAANRLAMKKAIALVEEVRRRTGITPDDEALPGLLREPLPSVRWNGYFQEIRYRRTGNANYELSYYDMAGFLGDTIVYDNVRGWRRVPF